MPYRLESQGPVKRALQLISREVGAFARTRESDSGSEEMRGPSL